MPKLKVKYADGTIDEIKLYTEEPALAIFAILVGGNLLCGIGRGKFTKCNEGQS